MSDTIRATIVQTINKIRVDSGREPVTPDDQETLTGGMGLDSLDLAVLVVSLEKELGVDPFRDGTASARTLGELVSVYKQAAA